MASPLSWLQGCKSAQLKAVATLAGISSSGTKPVLISRLLQDLRRSLLVLPTRDASVAELPQTPHHSIVSIDMGIRNLAYCRLSLPARAAPATLPTLTEWTRIAISRPPDPSTSQVREAFDPATFAQHAHALISTIMASQPPAHILIERQRFRSNGAAMVLEWTLRVNMFEAMLYAVLTTLTARGLWSGTVHAVMPDKVSAFWVGRTSGKGAAKQTKEKKVGLVEKWLEEGEKMALEGRAKEVGRAFSEKRKGPKKVVVLAEGEDMDGKVVDIGKLDDLADCVLQGMAWLEWEKNRKSLVSNGLSAMNRLL